MLTIIKLLLFIVASKEVLCGVRIEAESLRKFRNKLSLLQSDLDDQKISPSAARIIESIPSGARKGSSSLQFYACNACQAMIDEFMYIRRVELFSDSDLVAMAIDVCALFEFESEQICEGIVNLYAPTVIYIVDNRPDLSADTVCKFLLNDGECANPHADDSLEFEVSIDARLEDEKSTPNEESTANSEELIIVHLTDIHVDLKYKEGSLAACKNFACCRDTNVADNSSSLPAGQLAGHWGSYHHCDTPLRAVEDAFRQIVKQHPKIDAIYFTGDIVDHHLYDTTIDGTKASLNEVHRLVREIFGTIPVYPALGNHENQNLFAPIYVDAPSFSTQWLYNHVAELWGMPQLQTVKDGGYYTKLIKPGLRVIALNNNLCLIYNFWVLFDVEPIREQFQWLHDTLLEAEEANEKVHILAHIPSGVESYHEACSREYQRIVERFHRTIAAQFNGHTEYFDFHLTYEATNISKAIAVAFNGGAIASHSKQNRNYMVYGIGGESFEVKEVELWSYNLTAANQHGKSQQPQWQRQFSLREQFNLPDLTATTLNKLVLEMAKNSSIFEQYWRMKIKNSDLFLEKGCDSSCLEDSLCEIVTSDNTNTILCENLTKERKRGLH